MRSLVAVAVAVSFLAVAGPAQAILTISNNASFVSVDSGAPVPVDLDYVPHSAVGTTASSSLAANPTPNPLRPGFVAAGQVTSSGGAVDADSVFDIQFTTDHYQYFALGGYPVSPAATGSFSSSDGIYHQVFQGSFNFNGGLLRPGVDYHLVAELRDAVGSFTVVLYTPEPSFALLALFALAGLTLRRAALPRSRPRPRASLPAGR